MATELDAFLTSVPHGGKRLHSPAALLLGKELSVSFGEEASWSQCLSVCGGKEKIYCPKIRITVVQPEGSDSANHAHKYDLWKLKNRNEAEKHN
jgi:hypothetical protein